MKRLVPLLLVIAVQLVAPPKAHAADWLTVTIDSGSLSSIAIGSDGLPVIAYPGLNVAHCGNPNCSAGNTIHEPTAPTACGGFATSIAVGLDGLPIVSCFDANNRYLNVVHCGDVMCASGNVESLVDSYGYPGLAVIAIGADGLPAIAYYEANPGGDLKFAHCTDVSCSSSAISVVDAIGAVGDYADMTIGSDGLPIMSYHDYLNGLLKFAHCGDATCSSGNSITVLDGGPARVGQYTSVIVGSDHLPLISYFDSTNASVRVLHCGNLTCTADNSIATLGSLADVGDSDSTVLLTPAGMPAVIAGGRIYRCLTATCSSVATPEVIDSAGGEPDATIDLQNEIIVSSTLNAHIQFSREGAPASVGGIAVQPQPAGLLPRRVSGSGSRRTWITDIGVSLLTIAASAVLLTAARRRTSQHRG